MVRETELRNRSCSGSALVDPKATERLAKAAESAGFTSVQQLVDFVVDSGLLALPPTDGITETFDLQQLGAVLRAQLASVLPKDRPEWFRGLAQTQQIALVTVLRARGYSSLVIARDFGIDPLEVNRVWNDYSASLGSKVINVRLDTLVGNMQLVAERASEGAMEKADWGTYWRIQKELIALLQSLGIVKQAARKLDVAVKFEDQAKAEVDAILELERKQRMRLGEIAAAQSGRFDAVPETVPAVKAASMAGRFEDDE